MKRAKPALAMVWLALLAAPLLGLAAFSARADDIAMLPLGDPARAYLLASGNAGDVIDCRDLASKDAARFDDVVADLVKADVVLIGEHHTNLPGHQFQANLLSAILAAGRPVVLGMEFFEITDDKALAQYVAGSADLATMLRETDWYGASGGNYNFAYYQPLVDAMRAARMPVRGINIPRDWVRTVSRSGRDKLTDEQRSFVPDPGAIDNKHHHVVNRMMGGFGASMPDMFDGMYRGQTTWDAAMAQSILRIRSEASGEKPLIVVIVGVGHVGHGLGIPARLKTVEPSLDVRVVSPVSAVRPKEEDRVHPGFVPKETATFSRGYGDYVYVLPDTGGEDAYPSFGLRLAPAGGASTEVAVEIAGVTPNGIAARAGLRKGDRIRSIAGIAVNTVPDAAIALNSLGWDRVVPFVVERLPASSDAGESRAEVVVPVVVIPAVDGDEDWLKSRVAGPLVDGFDPMSERTYTNTGKETPEGVHTRVVMFREKPVRIDEMNGPLLLRAWKLDEQGRASTGYFSIPDAAGAVKIELARDESGRVLSKKRWNLAGQPIEP